MGFIVVEETGFLRLRMTGVLTGADLVELSAATREIELRSERVPHRMTDLRAVSRMDIGFPEVQALADERRSYRFPNAFRSAIVVGNPVQLGMASMFRTLNDNPQICIEIFEEEALAIRWLQEV